MPQLVTVAYRGHHVVAMLSFRMRATCSNLFLKLHWNIGEKTEPSSANDDVMEVVYQLR